jgi:membrane protease YdiL (CAAX protease family)
LLLRELIFGYQYKPLFSAIVVSTLFGALHLLNTFSYATLHYAIVQTLCAFAISFNLSAIYYKFKSIVPCIIIHACINITSIGLDTGLGKLSLNSFEATVFLIVAILYLIHGYRLFSVKQFCIDKGDD